MDKVRCLVCAVFQERKGVWDPDEHPVCEKCNLRVHAARVSVRMRPTEIVRSVIEGDSHGDETMRRMIKERRLNRLKRA